MLEHISSVPQPFFLPSSLGQIFAVYHKPIGATTIWGNVLVVPPFNEEMNRCRSMVTIQAQALARLGVGTLVIDLYGTGESDGEYGDSRWNIWCENVHQGIEWLDSQSGGCSGLLGIRLGAPLTLRVVQQDQNKRALIFWQPVVDGKTYLTQFMRMRIAANMDRNDIPKETTSGMRAQLAEGKSVEIAGYEIHPELATAIDNLRLSELIPHETTPVVWFEKGVGDAASTPSPASAMLLDSWRQAGSDVQAILFGGPAFWSLHERDVAPDLVKMTADWVQLLRPEQ